jgi:hypothetical protein
MTLPGAARLPGGIPMTQLLKDMDISGGKSDETTAAFCLFLARGDGVPHGPPVVGME